MAALHTKSHAKWARRRLAPSRLRLQKCRQINALGEQAVFVRAGTAVAPLETPYVRTPTGATFMSGNRVLTLAESVRQQIADDILRGALSPGARLDEIGLAKRFNLSRTPVR